MAVGVGKGLTPYFKHTILDLECRDIRLLVVVVVDLISKRQSSVREPAAYRRYLEPHPTFLDSSVGDSFYNDLGLEKILVTVRHPVTREIVQFERDRNTPNLRPSHGYALVSQAIRAHGMPAPIGQVEIHAASSSLRAKDLMEVAQKLDDLIQAAIRPIPAAQAA